MVMWFSLAPVGTLFVTKDGTTMKYIKEVPGYGYLCESKDGQSWMYHSEGVPFGSYHGCPKTIIKMGY